MVINFAMRHRTEANKRAALIATVVSQLAAPL